MTSFYDSHDYYKKMLELQEKLRKSEEERIRLDERFKILVQESRNRHDACINRLRLRYIEFLEEQRTRDERNYKLLEALDSVDNSLALMTSKTNRLNVLRKQYEAYLRQIYAVRSPPRSIIDDNDTTGPIRDKYLGRNAIEGLISLPREVRSISSPQTFLSNLQTSTIVSPSRMTKSTQNTYPNDYQQNIIQSRASNQQINDSPLQIHQKIQQSPSPNFSPRVLQQRQPYYDDNAHIVSHKFQVESNLHVPNASPRSQIDSSNRNTVQDFNKSSPRRMEPYHIQTMPYLVTPEYTNDNILKYKPVDMVRNQTTPTTSQYCISPSLVMRSLRHTSTKQLPSNSSKNDNVTSPGFRTTPIITECNVPDTSLINARLNLSRQPLSIYLGNSLTNSEYYQKPVSDSPVCSLKSSYGSYATKRNERFIPKRLTNAYRSATSVRQVPSEEDRYGATEAVENELDRYIDKIRKLYRDLDQQSFEEVDEQSKSRDISNATLLDDEFSTRDKPERNLSKGVENVLALADDLAVRTADDFKNGEREREDKNRNLELIRTTQTYKPISVENSVESFGARERRATSMTDVKDEISSNVALVDPELDLRGNIEKPEKENIGEPGGVHALGHYEQLPEAQEDGYVASKSVEPNGEDAVSENTQEETRCEGDNVYMAEQTNLEQHSFNVAEELEPWNLDRVEKQVKEMDLIGEIEEQSMEKEFNDVEKIELPSEADTVENQAEEQQQDLGEEVEITDSNDTKDQSQAEGSERFNPEEAYVNKNETEARETFASQDQESKHEDGTPRNAEFSQDNFDEQKEYDNKQEEEDKTSHAPVNENDQQEITKLEEQNNDQNHIEESNENYAENPEATYGDSNEGFDYDQNASYANNENQEYQGYENEEYAQDPNKQYQEYTSEQYDQYDNNPENQYEHDPQAQYQEDANQQYSYTYDEQYDPNKEYETDANQSYEPYQTEVTQEEERGKTEEEQREKYEEQREEPKSQETEENPALEKVDENQSKSRQLSSENEPKKKKDVIKSLLDSDTDSTIERNVSNTESDFDFN